MIEIDSVATVMAALPEPAPPAAFKATVMARIAREVDRQQAAAADPSRRRRESPVWLWTLAGGAASVVGATAYGWAVSGALPDVVSPLIGHGIATLIPMEAPIAIVVGLGLLAYVAALFAPLRPTPNATSRR